MTGFQRGQYRVLAATDVKEMKRQEKRRAKEERREQKKIAKRAARETQGETTGSLSSPETDESEATTREER